MSVEIDWMGGAAPDSWRVYKLKHILREEEKELGGDESAGAISYGEVVYKQFDNDETLATYRAVRPGQFLINPLNLNYDLKSLRIALSRIECRVSPAYIVASCDEHVARAEYLKWALRVFDVQHIKTLGAGVRQTVKFEDIGACPIALPSIECQESIANHLDRATGRIDALVRKKTRFIGLLREKRQALITHAVTQGIRPSVRKKRAGCASKVTIPQHWKVVEFWTIARQVSAAGMPNEPLMSVYLDRGVIPYSEGGGLVHKPSESLDAYQLVEPGNFVLNNQQAWRGSVGVSRHRGIVSPAYLVFALSDKIDPNFANYQFRESRFVDEMMLSSQGVGDIQRQVKWPLLRAAKVLLPPIDEQREIGRHLDMATRRIDTLIAKTERSIDLLREHRTALITAAVTGKLNLRDAA